MADTKRPDAAIERLVRESRFVFTGTIEREASSSLSFVPSGPETSVVRVERVHQATPALHNQAGQRVTVVAAQGSTAAPDKRRVFFTNPFLYGETIAVREVGNMEAPEDLDALNALIAGVAEEDRVQEHREHRASAHAVVHGRVMGVQSAHDIPVSEHDPLWMVAAVRVTRSVKGDLEGEIHVRFPGSRDIMWYGVPKLKEGDEGTFILHRDGLAVGKATLAIIHPDDFLPGEIEEARRIADRKARRPSKR
jgi:hypothetical protein